MSVYGLSKPNTGPCRCVRYLIATSETPNSTPSSGREQERFAVVFDVAAGRDPHKSDTDRQDRALDGNQRRKGGALRPL